VIYGKLQAYLCFGVFDLSKKSSSRRLHKIKLKMAAKEKLSEAEYFLNMLKKTPWRDPVFAYNLSAFLSSWRSVLDVMLFDFAQLYALGFEREDHLDYEGFEIAAKALGRKQALEFLKWWKRECEKLARTPLYRARNIVVHKGTPPIAISIPLTGPSPAPSSIGEVIQKMRSRVAVGKGELRFAFSDDQFGSLVKLLPKKPWMITMDAMVNEVLFDINPVMKAKDACQVGFERMKKIVETSEKKYWRKERPRAADVGINIIQYR